MTTPCWTSAFFEWQFRLNSDHERRNLIAAYDGPHLAGVLLGTDYPFRSPAGVHKGSQWSWLSVHPEYRGRGIAKLLDQERIRRQTAADSRLIVSYRYIGSAHSQTERPHGDCRDPKFNRAIGFWARVLQPKRFSQWHWNRLEVVFARMTSPFTRIPLSASQDVSVRAFVMDDLDACLELTRAAFASSTLTIAWDRESLRHQLNGHDLCQTLVIEEDGCITGYINYHLLTFRAKTMEQVAIIDLIVFGKASAKGRIRLLNAALARMLRQDAILALKVRCGDTRSWPLIRTHFVPEPRDSLLVLQSLGDSLAIPKSSPIHVLWR